MRFRNTDKPSFISAAINGKGTMKKLIIRCTALIVLRRCNKFIIAVQDTSGLLIIKRKRKKSRVLPGNIFVAGRFFLKFFLEVFHLASPYAGVTAEGGKGRGEIL